MTNRVYSCRGHLGITVRCAWLSAESTCLWLAFWYICGVYWKCLLHSPHSVFYPIATSKETPFCGCSGSNVGLSEQFSHSVIYMYFFPTKSVMSLKLNKYKKTDQIARCFSKITKSQQFSPSYTSRSCHVCISIMYHISATGFNRPFQHSQHVRIQYDLKVIVHENWIHASNIVYKDQNSHLKRTTPTFRDDTESKSWNLFFDSTF